MWRAMVLLAAALLAGCGQGPPPPVAAAAPEVAPAAIDRPQPPFDLNTYEGVVADIVANLDEGSVARLRRTAKADLIAFHHGWGAAIRNHYGFWSNDALIRSCARRAGHGDGMHPDSASMLVMEGVWAVVRSMSRGQGRTRRGSRPRPHMRQSTRSSVGRGR